MAGVTCRVSEALQQELMHDPRVALRLPELMAVISEEMRWVTQVAPEVWQLLAAPTGMHWEEMAQQCIGKAHISYHFIWRRILEPATEYPWSLLHGCVDAIADNLRELKGGAEPSEPFSLQLWQLLREDRIAMDMAVAIVRLLGEVGWSSLPAEQQHGSLAGLSRWHPEYTVETLVSRALIVQVSKLLPTQCKDEKQIESICRNMRKILASNPEKSGGRQLFFKHSIESCLQK